MTDQTDPPDNAAYFVVDVNQFVPALAQRDAVSDHALQLNELFRACGRAQLFYEHADPHSARLGKHHREYRNSPDRHTVNLLHLSIGTGLVAVVERTGAPLVINYHDITPSRFFEPFDREVAHLLRSGRQQLSRLAPAASGAWADSVYTQKELMGCGYRRTAAIPILIDPSRFLTRPSATLVERIRTTKDQGPDLLFVGRLAPNKKIEDLINLLHVYDRYVGRGGRLFIVGARSAGLTSYWTALERHAQALLGDRAVFVGSIDDEDLAAYYSTCDVYVSMSEHEGFGVPYVEAMHHGLPILALGRAATEETVGGAGIVLERRDYLEFALALHRIFTHSPLRHSLILGAARQRVRFSHGAVAARVLDFMKASA